MKSLKILLLLTFLSLGAIAQNVAINTTGAAPDASAMLDVQSTNKGFLPPRVALTSINDATTIATPATGLVVYNTNASITNGSGAGLYINTGTTAAPVWAQINAGNATSGSIIGKVIYTAYAPDVNKTVTVGNFIFRYNTLSGTQGIPQFCLASNPGTTVNVYWGIEENYALQGYQYGNAATSFNSSNYSTFQYLTSTADGMASYELNQFYIADVANQHFYHVRFYISGPGPYIYTLVAEEF